MHACLVHKRNEPGDEVVRRGGRGEGRSAPLRSLVKCSLSNGRAAACEVGKAWRRVDWGGHAPLARAHSNLGLTSPAALGMSVVDAKGLFGVSCEAFAVGRAGGCWRDEQGCKALAPRRWCRLDASGERDRRFSRCGSVLRVP